MKNNGIEDIMIDANYNSNRKKSKKGIVIFFVLLLILGIGVVYFYFLQSQASAKELFFTNLSNLDMKNILDNSIYEQMANRVITEDTEITTKANFSSNMENQNLEEIDISKFLLELTNKNDVEASKTYSELKVSYSENEIFKAKMLSNEELIAVTSDEISGKYIGLKYDSIKDIFGIDIDSNFIKSLKNSRKVTLTDEQKKEYINKYIMQISESVPEEKFEVQENILIQKASSSSNATAYILTLTQDELRNIIVNLLTNLKKDESLLNELITKEENIISEEYRVYEGLARILLGNKINTNIKDLQKAIDNTIDSIKKWSGNGVVIKLYVTDLGIEKINVVLPNENTLDFEFTKKSEEQDILKITYLYKGTNSGLDFLKKDKVKTYSAEDGIEELEEEVSTKDNNNFEINGFSLEIDKTKKEANTSINITYSFIENEVINKKININLRTDGTQNSKTMKNSIVISQGSNDGKSGQMTIDNIIKFTNVSDIEDLTEENCVFLDNLNQEDANSAINEIKNRFEELYSEKKSNLNLIDVNTKSSIIRQELDAVSSNISKDEARKVLADKVTGMMQEALDNNQEFTLQNLVDLKIDGFEVSSIVNETTAIIVVDIYTFNIDSNFNLTDA